MSGGVRKVNEPAARLVQQVLEEAVASDDGEFLVRLAYSRRMYLARLIVETLHDEGLVPYSPLR